MRNLSARWTGLWNTNTRMALAVGLLIGALEVCSKAYVYGKGVAFDLRSLLNLISWSSSLPIHAALSLAFYALPSWRLPLMIGLHAVLNATILAITALLWGQMSIPAIAVTSLAAITAVCTLIGWAAQRA
jgi:hypothetical protein